MRPCSSQSAAAQSLPAVAAIPEPPSEREPAKVGIAVWVSMGNGTEADWAKEARFWKQAGASCLCLTKTFNRRHHKRILGHTMGDHLATLRRYHSAVADAL